MSTDIRDAFFDTMYELAEKDPNLIFLTADMGAWSLERFRECFADRFINVGIAEQNMLGMAAGLTLSGKKVFTYAIAPFMSQRACEQTKIDLAVMGLPVVLVGAGPGITYSQDGPSHHAMDDVAMMRALPGMTILNPSDQATARAAALEAHASRGPCYVRLDKGIYPVLHPMEHDFTSGMGQVRPGDELCIVSTGTMTHVAIQVATRLGEAGIETRVLDAYRLKPLAEAPLALAACQCKAIVTLEENFPTGGLGSAVAETLADLGLTPPLLRLAAAESYPKRCGSREWLRQSIGLGLETLVEQCQDFHSRAVEKGPRTIRLTPGDFAGCFGVSEHELPDTCRRMIETGDFSYRPTTSEQKIDLLFKGFKRLYEDLSVSGPHRISDWERGWSENLKAFTDSGHEVKTLVPKFVHNGVPVRFRGEYILPVNPNFETAFVSVLREFLFRRYFAEFDSVYEFGCGTGHNLIHLAEIYPQKPLTGLDWSEASVCILDTASRTLNLNLTGRRFDMYHPDSSVTLGPGAAVLTIGAMEQLGTHYHAFLDYLLEQRPGLVINVETLHELNDQENCLDFIASKYLEKRGYLQGYLTRLRELESKDALAIKTVRKTFGSFFHDGYSFIVWKPRF